MKLHTPRAWAPAVLAALAATLALTACGGNDDDGYYAPPVAEAPGTLPASATANAAAFSNYLAALPPSDSAEPLTLGAVVPPVSDTDEPVPVAR
jgi:hypothetical protein